MKTSRPSRPLSSGNALVITMILTATAVLTLSGIMAWSSGGAKVSTRYTQYTRVIAAAEAATEKVESHLANDFQNSGEALVTANLTSYQSVVPAASDSTYWTNWQFSDGQGNLGKTYVACTSSSNFTTLSGTYAGMKAYVSTYSLVSDTKQSNDLQGVTSGVLQQVQLTTLPMFQFLMYSSDDMEIGCGAPFTNIGFIHANGNVYVEPDSQMTFANTVTAAGSVVFGRDPLDSRGAPAGSVIYDAGNSGSAPVLILPIGATNTSAVIAQILQPPPNGESATSALGSQRFYNKVDMILKVTSSGFSGTSGRYNNFTTTIPSNQLAKFVTVSSNFYDVREGKTVHPIDINIGQLTKWSGTNTVLPSGLGRQNIDSLYVYDQRTMVGTNLQAVRLYNGTNLPAPLGLTIATADPLYVLGDYNQTNGANLYTSNTTTTVPAMLAADAITFLSNAWQDSNSTASLNTRWASWSTLNAAIIAGQVYTTNGDYSGGMESFIRFLEDWSQWNTFTFNGSMAKLFPSAIATNEWGNPNAFSPPTRNWAFDNNFYTPSKLPPLTPSLQTVARSQWITLAPNSTTAGTNTF